MLFKQLYRNTRLLFTAVSIPFYQRHPPHDSDLPYLLIENPWLAGCTI
jgi:hypothetical protein